MTRYLIQLVVHFISPRHTIWKIENAPSVPCLRLQMMLVAGLFWQMCIILALGSEILARNISAFLLAILCQCLYTSQGTVVFKVIPQLALQGHALHVTGHCASTPASHCCWARTGFMVKKTANKVQSSGDRSWHTVVVVVVVVVVAVVDVVEVVMNIWWEVLQNYLHLQK